MSADPRVATPEPAPADAAVRAAWLYYVEGLTQATIARLMRVSRGRVIALLAGAREQGIVRVHIDAKASSQVALEESLCARFRLAEAIVVPSPASDTQVANVVGHAAGAYLGEHLRDGMRLGVGWGATLQMTLKSIGNEPRTGVSVVSLLGGTTHSRAVTPPAVARRMADAFGAECYQLTAPLIVADEKVRDALWAEPALRDLRERAREMDMALVSVGDVSSESPLFRAGIVSRNELPSLVAAGAVGDVLCRFIDARGRLVDHPINRRVMAVDLVTLRHARSVVVASGGRRKVAALAAVLQAVPVSVLITDEAAARGLLDG
jgi:DNA-binding transcriptional regulator LsrR (DeoR family)